MVLVVAPHNLPKPCTDLGRAMMLPALKLGLDGFELRHHSLLRCNPPDDESSAAAELPTEVGEAQEREGLGLTSLTTNGRPLVALKLNRRRALFVLSKIDEILAWERSSNQERDVRFVELGRYLCEVRAGQFWRLDNLRSFDEFLETKFPESRRKAYYLMTIHEHLPRIPKPELRQVGWTKAVELVKVARRDGRQFDCATWLHKAREMPKEEF